MCRAISVCVSIPLTSQVCIWDPKVGKPIKTLAGHTDTVLSSIIIGLCYLTQFCSGQVSPVYAEREDVEPHPCVVCAYNPHIMHAMLNWRLQLVDTLPFCGTPRPTLRRSWLKSRRCVTILIDVNMIEAHAC